MPPAQSNAPALRTPLRLWPGVILVALQWIVRFIVPLVVPGAVIAGVLGGVAGGLAVLLWWLFFSRAPWAERIGALALMAVAIVATLPALHESIRTGMMGNLFFLHVMPPLCLALVVWAAAGRRLAGAPRYASMAAAFVLACAVFTLLRTDGVSGEGGAHFRFRWTPTAEQRLLARAGGDPAASTPPATPTPVEGAPVEEPAVPGEADGPAPAPAAPAVAEKPGPAASAEAGVEPAPAAAPLPPAKPRAAWPGFRGPGRDGVVPGVRIETDWGRTPPVELWRRPIGPGWSSFAVSGGLVYTQEQRGEDEIVSCYRLATGEPVWTHRDGVRFWESNGGPGPRGTPAVHGGRVYAFGATGILNALDARTGALAWSRNAAAETGTETPGWGFASSPLIVDGLVVVAVAGQLAAYDAASGAPRWVGPSGGGGYSSPHLATIDGVAQILLLRGGRTISVAPADGTLLWDHQWQPGVGIVQPAVPADGDVLITVGDAMGGVGMRRLAVSRGPGGWTIEERWTTRGLKPYFNDFVVHEGHAYGFDGSILACIDLRDGERKWKGGRYGHGQLVLLPEQDLLLLVSEEGELALVKATPDQFTGIARVPAIEGKTWNHPVVAGDVLLVRNGEEMAAFRLPLAGR